MHDPRCQLNILGLLDCGLLHHTWEDSRAAPPVCSRRASAVYVRMSLNDGLAQPKQCKSQTDNLPPVLCSVLCAVPLQLPVLDDVYGYQAGDLTDVSGSSLVQQVSHGHATLRPDPWALYTCMAHLAGVSYTRHCTVYRPASALPSSMFQMHAVAGLDRAALRLCALGLCAACCWSTIMTCLCFVCCLATHNCNVV
jgi:hypothetical protein